MYQLAGEGCTGINGAASRAICETGGCEHLYKQHGCTHDTGDEGCSQCESSLDRPGCLVLDCLCETFTHGTRVAPPIMRLRCPAQ